MQSKKKYLTSNASLQLVFHSFRAIEKIQISNFKDEFLRSGTEIINESVNFLKEIYQNFPLYVYKKIYPKYCQALNYQHVLKSKNSW